MEKTQTMEALIENLFKAGAHFALSRTRRHPSVSPYIFGVKNRVEIFDLEQTSGKLVAAADMVANLSKHGKQILLVSGKSEAKDSLRAAAQAIGQPYVAGRFVGGTLTNFAQIKKRVDRLEKLLSEKEKGELIKYTKKERLLIDREITRLEHDFGGIVSMKQMPAALVVIDPKREHIAVKEAKLMKIPVIALANSDCNIKLVDYAVPGNDSLRASVELFLSEIIKAWKEGKGKIETEVA